MNTLSVTFMLIFLSFSLDGLSREETIDQPYEEEITDDPEVTEGTEVC
jgi:hypothetical protein